MNFGNKVGEQKAPFPMTSMIDILFIMLIFFITTSIFAQFEAEISIEVPKSTAAKSTDRNPLEIIINITSDGRYIINQIERPLKRDNESGGIESIETILLRLAAAFKKEGQTPHVIIRASKETKYDNVIQVLTECKNAKVENVSFAVIKEEKEGEKNN
jgi:biopolymer transport protein ExbD